MIDLYSDTATLPTEGMWRAMRSASLGDEQRGTDPAVLSLEQRAAVLLGQEAALLVPSATMANQVALTVHCAHGSEVLCHETAHVYNFEGGGIATNARAQVVALRGERGMFTRETLIAALRPDDVHFARSRVVVLENTSNLAGGLIWDDATFQDVVQACRERGLLVHLDGARLFNAAVARKCGVDSWSAQVDSVQVCFSKGLGCPFGAILAGSQAFISAAKRVKQSFGGALRQAGIIAAAMNYALDHHVSRLAHDHERLARLAARLSGYAELEVYSYETNLLYFRHMFRSSEAVKSDLLNCGVCVSTVGDRLRMCTHLNVDDQSVELVEAALDKVFR